MGEKEQEKEKKNICRPPTRFYFLSVPCVQNGSRLKRMRPPTSPLLYPVCVWGFFVETSVNTYGPEREAESQSARDQSGTAHNTKKAVHTHHNSFVCNFHSVFSLSLSILTIIIVINLSARQ